MALPARPRYTRLGLIVLLTGLLLLSLSQIQAAASDLFFSEYIEGSSNNKALEIFNGTGAPVDLSTGGYNVQMHFNGNPAAGLTINLVGTVADGDVFVLAQASANAAILAQADQTNGAGWFNGDDAVVLRKGALVLDVIGQIGFDPGTEWGAGLLSTADNTLRRKAALCAGDIDGANIFDPSFEWDGFATDAVDGLGAHVASCGGPPVPTNPTGIGAGNPASVETGQNTLLTVAVTPGTNPASTGLAVVVDLSSIGGSAAQSFFDDGSNGDVTAGDNVFSYLANVPVGTTGGSKTLTATISDAELRTGSANIGLNVLVVVAINQIQGSAHQSTFVNQVVRTTGIITAKKNNGFWIQSDAPDSDDATSEGIFVFTNSAPSASLLVGDNVTVVGRVTEFRPGAAADANLTITELTSPSTTVNSSGNPLPAPIILGAGGRIPPNTVINNDGAGNVEAQPPATFDAGTDGIDFYESLEGMRVQVNNAVVVGSTNNFGEIWVLGDNGAGASPRTARGGILINAGDFNPERIQLDDTVYPGGSAAWPQINIGAKLTSPAVGVLDYSFGNFEVLVTDTFTVDTSTQVTREVTALAGSASRLTIATFNVENLGGNADATDRAEQIVNNLGSPDIVVLEEIQDNNGTTNDGTVDATTTFNNLISSIQAAGGPAYAFAQINPTDGEDGGAPGGNIRVGFLYNPARVTFNPIPGGDATTPNSVICTDGVPSLALNPGRIDPNNIAWDASRKPLVGQFEFNGESIFVVGVHFNSKGGDNPLMGAAQPPVLGSETQRLLQAQVVNAFATDILNCASDASVIVLGDVNDFQFSAPVATLKGTILHNLFDLLPSNEQYSYVFDGNSQVLDQMVVSSYLRNSATPVYDVVHVNAEFTDQVSDHDPSVAQFLPVLPVRLDIRPLLRPNLINLQSHGVLLAAVLGSSDVNVTLINPNTVTLAGAPIARLPRGRLLYSFLDINFDRRLDLVMTFNIQDLELEETDTEAVLLGKTLSGTKIRGVDSVDIIVNGAPILRSPADGSTVATSTPTLKWSNTLGGLCYLVQIDDESSFTSPLVQSATVVISNQYQAFSLTEGTYFWRIQVGGTCNITPSAWSEVWSFTVDLP